MATFKISYLISNYKEYGKRLLGEKRGKLSVEANSIDEALEMGKLQIEYLTCTDQSGNCALGAHRSEEGKIVESKGIQFAISKNNRKLFIREFATNASMYYAILGERDEAGKARMKTFADYMDYHMAALRKLKLWR